jgi:arylsulfatase A-like enzyme
VSRETDRTYPEGSPFPGTIGRTVASSVPAWPRAPQPRPGSPNVVVVLLDDVGFAQFGCFGAEIETPVFDGLAASGLRYRDFHTTALCTPTRAALLTGRNHHANASGVIDSMARGFPGYHTKIPRENGFLSEILRLQGYATFALGKWHITPYHETAVGSTHETWPSGRGFDRFYGFLGGRTHQYVPDLIYDDHSITPPRSIEAGYHLNADLADRAIEFIGDLRAVSPDRPFFLYYCPGAGHEPHQVPREWADRYAGRFDTGWERLRETIHARQLETGLLPRHTKLSPRPDWVDAWETLGAREQRMFARQMEVYAGFITHTDHHIGRVVEFLDRLGELENTVFLVTSDNGASSEGGRFGRGGYTPELATLEANLRVQDELGGPTTLPNYGWGWAWAGNTPFKRWKRYVHEGGISDPLIVHWPARVRARGEIRHQYAHVVDILPTLLEVLDVPAPGEIAGVSQSAFHGLSFAHTFDDAAASTRKTVQYYEMMGSRAIWAGGWKAVTAQEPTRPGDLTDEMLDAQLWELYDTERDPSECTDLAETEPGRLRELIDLWWAEAKKYDVLPIDAARGGGPHPGGRDRYVYYPGGAPVPRSLAADVINRAHRVTAELDIPAGGAEGVILAHGGGAFGGYTFFLKEGRLSYVQSYPGVGEHHVRSDVVVPAGRVTVGFEFTPTAKGTGRCTLRIGDRIAGDGPIAKTLTVMGSAWSEGLCCGYDGGLPVSDEYASPFTFTGTIFRVVVEIAGG